MEVAKALEEKLRSRTATVGVVGLGYVGLPLALALGSSRLRVTGFDVDEQKIDRIARGESYLEHIPSERIAEAVQTRGLSATLDFDQLAHMDAIIVAVPTPLTRHREPDMRFVESTMRQIAKRLRRGQLVILESTTYPGTTDELVLDILTESGLEVGVDFFLAFSPERE